MSNIASVPIGNPGPNNTETDDDIRDRLGLQARVFYTVGSTDADYIGTTHTAIQEALDAVHTAGGGEVKMKDHSFTLGTQLKVYDNTIFSGSGYSTVLVDDGVYTDNLIINGDQTNGNFNIIFRDFKVEGTGLAGSAFYLDGTSTHSNNISFKNVWITGVGGMGIHPKRTDNLRINDCLFESVGTTTLNHGLYVLDCDNVEVTNTVSKNNVGAGFKASTSTGQNTNITFTNCTASGNGGRGFSIADSTNAATNGCIASGNGDIGIAYLEETTGITNGSITGCVSYDNVETGITVDNSFGISVVGNSCNTNGTYGMSFRNSSRLAIAGNNCLDNSQTTTNTYSGIWLNGTTRQSTVVGNVCNNSGTTQKYGIEISDTANNLTIAGNMLNANQTAAYNNSSSGASICVSNNLGLNPIFTYAQGNITGATTFNRVNGNVITATLTGDITVTLTDGKIAGDELTLILTQDGSGSRLVTWPSNFKKASGTLTLSTGLNAVDAISMRWDGTNWREISRSLNES